MNVTRALRALRLHPWLGPAAGFGIFAVAFGLRFALEEALRELPFITLFPAILLAALVGGGRVGILVTVLSFDPATSASLGVRIIQNLAKQLRGELTFDSSKGVATRLVFPVA